MGGWINTSHSGPYDFLQRVPLIFYGPGIIRSLGRFHPDRHVTLADVAPTYARLMNFDFPPREGSAVGEVLRDDARPPKLIVTVTIDGGGWNVLNYWPEAWPVLDRMMDAGATVMGTTVGSSPSVTPAIHANISTGTFPSEHGVTSIAVRRNDGEISGAFSQIADNSALPVDPDLNLRVTTIGDVWDRATENKAKVGLVASGTFILGMLGHGAATPGGDRDVAALLQGKDRWITDRHFYSLPSYINNAVKPSSEFKEEVDRADGEADGKWLGHDLDSLDTGHTPALGPWQTEIAEAILDRERFGRDGITDLFYVHFKSPDHVGHSWNMTSLEERDVISSVDSAIGELNMWLEQEVGRGNYVMVVTADHGQTPLDAGGWPINRAELLSDIQRRFDKTSNDRGIIERTSPTVLFSSQQEMAQNNTTPQDVSSFLEDYKLRENAPAGEDIPQAFRPRMNEPVFVSVIPGADMKEVAVCAGAAD
jgi:predicted AlkP superfamily pyrophosphatase or phosphodiesterase